MPLLEASCTPRASDSRLVDLAARKTLARQKSRTRVSGRPAVAKTRAVLLVELASQPALLPALRGWRERRPTSLLPCTIVHQQTAPQRCAPAMLLEHCDTLVSSGLLRTSVGDPYYVRSARGRPPMLTAVPGAAPVERSAEQPSTTTEDAGALHATRGASMTAPSNYCGRASTQRTESGPKGSFGQTKL